MTLESVPPYVRTFLQSQYAIQVMSTTLRQKKLELRELEKPVMDFLRQHEHMKLPIIVNEYQEGVFGQSSTLCLSNQKRREYLSKDVLRDSLYTFLYDRYPTETEEWLTAFVDDAMYSIWDKRVQIETPLVHRRYKRQRTGSS